MLITLNAPPSVSSALKSCMGGEQFQSSHGGSPPPDPPPSPTAALHTTQAHLERAYQQAALGGGLGLPTHNPASLAASICEPPRGGFGGEEGGPGHAGM